MDPPVLPECGGSPTEAARQALPSWAWLTRAGQMDWLLKQQFRNLNLAFPSLPPPTAAILQPPELHPQVGVLL